jgi:hypothetical protein
MEGKRRDLTTKEKKESASKRIYAMSRLKGIVTRNRGKMIDGAKPCGAPIKNTRMNFPRPCCWSKPGRRLGPLAVDHLASLFLKISFVLMQHKNRERAWFRQARSLNYPKR